MKLRTQVSLGILIVAAGLLPAVRAAKIVSDIAPQIKRQATVDIANGLAHRKSLEPVSPELASPFSPENFEKPDPAEVAAAAAAAVTKTPAAGTRPGTPGAAAAGPAPTVAPPGDRETLETLAAQITPSGMFQIGDKRQLIIKSTRFELGTRFTATYNNQDYELELVAIDRTTFTLRYRGEEITRPIKPGR